MVVNYIPFVSSHGCNYGFVIREVGMRWSSAPSRGKLQVSIQVQDGIPVDAFSTKARVFRGKTVQEKTHCMAAAIISGHQNSPKFHRENGGTLGMVPLTPYTPCVGDMYWVYPLLKGFSGGLNSKGTIPRVPDTL